MSASTRDLDDRDLLELLGDQLAVLVLATEQRLGEETVAVIRETATSTGLEVRPLDALLKEEDELVVAHPQIRNALGQPGMRYAVVVRESGRSSLLALAVDVAGEDCN